MNVTRSHPSSFFALALLALSGTLIACGESKRTEGSADSGSRDIVGIALLDNGEDGDNTILTDEAGYIGFWYTYDDKQDCVNENPMAGMTTPTPEPQGGMQFTMTAYADTTPPQPAAPMEGAQSMTDEDGMNTFGARFFGGGHTSTAMGGFGAGLGFGLNAAAGPQVYDLEEQGFTGLRFYGRSAVAAQAIHVKIKDAWSEPNGMKCIPRDEATCMPDQGCHDDPEVIAMLTTEWQVFEFEFSEFTRPGWSEGYTEPPASSMLDPKQAYQVQFQVDPVMSFDIWIDNVGFISGATAPGPTVVGTAPPAASGQ